jgi:predicted Zn-dependent protease
MPSARERPSPLNRLSKRVLSGLLLPAALAALFLPASRAADNPAKTLQTEFEDAKKSLRAGDLVAAQNHYIDTIVLGLRQLAQLSRSFDEPHQASAYLDSALKLKPEDVETQVDEAGTWFREGEVGKSEGLLKSVIANQAANARARGLLGRMYLFEGDSENAIQELKAR